MERIPTRELLENLDCHVLTIASNGKIAGISAGLREKLGYSVEELRSFTVLKILPIEYYQELFVRKTIWAKPFRNFRAHLRCADGKKLLVQISGYRAEKEQDFYYNMMIQELNLNGLEIDTGHFEENIKARQLLNTYISKQLLARAQSAVRSGYDHIPNEEREFTFLFADLVSYTSFAEKSSSDEIVDMLNISIGATSATILHSGGFVDKIMGDSIFAVFEKPMNALISAIEIQKQFNLLNMFRLKTGEQEIQLRIGINTGMCILASIGSGDFKEMTFIGDAVNTASRLEKKCMPGSILVSATTVETIRKNVDILDEREITVKGKEQVLHAFYINRISFNGPRGPVTLGLDDELY